MNNIYDETNLDCDYVFSWMLAYQYLIICNVI